MKVSAGQRGFTLLEIIVAISIFALIAAMTYPAMIEMLELGEAADAQTARLAELQKAMTLMGRDVEQIVDRPVGDGYGTEVAAVLGGGGSSTLLEFTRTGWRNPAGWPRSNLQRVAYLFSDGKLLRQSWRVLDRSVDSVPGEALLVEEVKAVEIRFLDDQRQWQSFWPPSDPDKPRLPRAIDIVLELEDWGRVNRIFAVAGGGV